MDLSTRRALLFVLICVLGGSLAMATGATVFDGEADTLADDRVVIQPAHDSSYAYLDDDDELVVNLTAASLEGDAEGLNANAVTTFADVFNVTYTDDEFAEVWLETEESSMLTFTANGESIEGEDNNVTLGPNDTVSIGIAVDTRGENVVVGDVREEDFAIHAQGTEATDGSVDGGDDGSDDGSDGLSIRVTGDGAERTLSAENADHGETVRFDLDRDGDGIPLDGANVTLDRLELTSSGGGSYELGVRGTPDPVAGVGPLETAVGAEPHAYLELDYGFDADDVEDLTLTFSADDEHLDDEGIDPADLAVFRMTDDGEWEELGVELPAESDADGDEPVEDRTRFETTTEDLSVFTVANHAVVPDAVDASVADEEVAAGETTDVTATVENVGGAAGEANVTLEVNGATVDRRNATLDPGESTTVDFPLAFEGSDVYDVSVLGTEAGSVTVTDAVTDSAEADGPGGEASIAGPEDERAAVAAPPEGDADPVEEPAGFGIADLGGLLLLLLVVLTVITLVRRAPRAGR